MCVEQCKHEIFFSTIVSYLTADTLDFDKVAFSLVASCEHYFIILGYVAQNLWSHTR